MKPSQALQSFLSNIFQKSNDITKSLNHIHLQISEFNTMISQFQFDFTSLSDHQAPQSPIRLPDPPAQKAQSSNKIIGNI